MAHCVIQFQNAVCLSECLGLYGAEEKCESALEKARWPDRFGCNRCIGHEYCPVYGRRLKRIQC